VNEQTLTVGEGAMAVQLAGDGNTVTMIVGGARFAHSQLHKRKATPKNINELLRTDFRGTSLVGRGEERGMLTEWRASEPTISVRCIIGGAGAGKTRLAIEACEDAEREDWFATFAPSGELKSFHARQNLIHWIFPKNALIVIDYAATSQAVLLDWFAALAPHRRDRGKKLRLLLLERHASAEAGWWKELTQAQSLDRDSAADLIDEKPPFELPTLNAASDRRALLAEVMEKAAALSDPPRRAVKLPELGAEPAFDALLAKTRPENEPLYLIMAGIYAVEHGAPTALALNKLELARRIAAIERDRLAKFAQAQGFGKNDPLPAHIVACVTLQNGCARAELAALVEKEREAFKLPAVFGDEQIASIISDYLPSDRDNVAPVLPDLIGEGFLLPVIEGDGVRKPAVQAEIVLRAWRRKPDGVLDTLIRCARDFAQGEAGHPAIRWLRTVMERSEDLGELVRISHGVPQQTLALREFAADIQMRIADVVRPLAQENPDAFTPLFAAVLNNLANRLSDLGRREPALAAAEEAVALYRQLTAARPDAFTPDLAMSLNNLASFLSDLGRREPALAAAEEAVALSLALSAARPDAFTPDLATSLSVLGDMLEADQRVAEAVTRDHEAVSRLAPYFLANPIAFGRQMMSYLGEYIRRTEAADAARDEALVVKISTALQDAGFLGDET
jgi:tetratricopeptide (TPR) repeat protein